MKKSTKEILDRRNFLKKVAYVAPTVIALGVLTAPSDAQAKGSRTSSTIRR